MALNPSEWETFKQSEYIAQYKKLDANQTRNVNGLCLALSAIWCSNILDSRKSSIQMYKSSPAERMKQLHTDQVAKDAFTFQEESYASIAQYNKFRNQYADEHDPLRDRIDELYEQRKPLLLQKPTQLNVGTNEQPMWLTVYDMVDTPESAAILAEIRKAEAQLNSMKGFTEPGLSSMFLLIYSMLFNHTQKTAEVVERSTSKEICIEKIKAGGGYVVAFTTNSIAAVQGPTNAPQTGSSSDHAIGVFSGKGKLYNTYCIFDPNMGEFKTNTYSKFSGALNDVFSAYNASEINTIKMT